MGAVVLRSRAMSSVFSTPMPRSTALEHEGIPHRIDRHNAYFSAFSMGLLLSVQGHADQGARSDEPCEVTVGRGVKAGDSNIVAVDHNGNMN